MYKLKNFIIIFIVIIQTYISILCPFNGNGEGNTLICYFDQQGKIYQTTKNEFCQNYPNFSLENQNNVYTLKYCLYHQCIKKDCHDIAKVFQNQNIESGIIKLKIGDELCLEDTMYHKQRKIIDLNYSQLAKEQESSQNQLRIDQQLSTIGQCCQTECRLYYNNQGCSSSGLFFTLNSFCDEFCKNRDLFLLNCPDTGCSSSVCLQINQNFPKFQHCKIQNQTQTLTLEAPTNLHSYFNKLVQQNPITYYFILCYDDNIQVPCSSIQHCRKQQCLNELSSYTKTCNKQGYFQTLDEFCDEQSQYNIQTYSDQLILCNGSECSNEGSCCNKACIQFRNTIIIPTCYQDSFCSKFCNTQLRINQVICQGIGCLETDCCQRSFNNGYCKADYKYQTCQTDSLQQIPELSASNQEQCDIAKLQIESTMNQYSFYCYEKNNQIFIEYDDNNYCNEKVKNTIIDINIQNCKYPPCNIYDCKYYNCIKENSNNFTGGCDSCLNIYNTAEQFCNSIIYNFKEIQKCEDIQCTYDQCQQLRYQRCLDQQINYKTKCSLNFEFYTLENYCQDNSKYILDNYYQCKDLQGNELNCTDCQYFKCMKIQTETTSICVQTEQSFYVYYGTLKDYCLDNSQLDYNDVYNTNLNCLKTNGCIHSLDCCHYQCLKLKQYKLCDNNYEIITPDQACQKQCYQNINITKQCVGDCTVEDCRKQKCLDELLDFPGNICYKLNPDLQFTFENDSRKFFIDKQSFCEYIKIEDIKDDYQDFVNNASYCENCDNEYCCCVENCLIDKSFISCTASTDSNEYKLTSVTQTCELGCKNQGIKIQYCEIIPNSVYRNCEQKECNYFQCVEQTATHQEIICLFGEGYSYQFFANNLQFCESYKGKNIDYMNKIKNENHKCNDQNNCSSEKDCCIEKCLNLNYHKACSDQFILLTKFQYCEIKCIQENPNFYYCFGQDGQISHCDDCSFQACQNYVEDTYRVKQISSSEVCGHNFEKFQKIEDFCNFIENQNSIKLIFCEDSNGQNHICNQQECCQKYCLENSFNFQPHCDNINYNFFHTLEQYCNVKCNQTSLQSYKINNNYATEYDCCLQKCQINQSYNVSCILTIENSLVFDLYTREGICDFECRNIPYSIHTCKNNNCLQSDCDYQKCLFETSKTNFNKFCGSNGMLYDTANLFCDAKKQEGMSNIIHIKCNDKQCNNHLDCCKASCIYNFKGNNICEINNYNCYDNIEDLCIKQCGWVQDPTSMFQPISQFIKDDDCDNNKQNICHLQKCIMQSCTQFVFQNNICYSNQNCTIYVLKTPQQLCEIFRDYNYQGCPTKRFDINYYNTIFNDLVLKQSIKICKDKDIPRNCTSEECQIWPCEKLLLNEQGNKVCYQINNEVFYETTNQYCIKNNNSIDHQFFRCNNEQCLSKEACCESICLFNNQSNQFVPLCGINYFEIKNINQYCKEKCHNKGFQELMCNNSICSIEHCRTSLCFDRQYDSDYSICNSQFQIVGFYVQCLRENLQTQFYNCYDQNENQINCTINDCKIFQCLYENEQYLEGAICLQQSINGTYFFQDKQEYCEFMIQNDIKSSYNLFSQQTMKCINSKNEITQCKDNCCTCSKCQKNLEGFQGQILASNDVLFYSPYEFCRWQFINKTPLEIKKCFGMNQTTTCLEGINIDAEIQEGTPTQTFLECLNNQELIDYQGQKFCGEDGILYDSNYEFCSKLLINQIKNFIPLTCNFECPDKTEISELPFCFFKQNKIDCSLKECQVYKCMAQLRKQNIMFPLCLNQPYNNIVFYKNSQTFCMDKIQNLDDNYILNQNTDINLECYLKNNCNAFLCYGLSFIKDYKIGRIGTKLITALEYQEYLFEKRFSNERDHPYFLNEVEFCYNDQGTQINCQSVCDIEADCEQYCVDYLRQRGYPFDTICIRNKFQEIEFYNNLNDFCIYVAVQEDYNFDRFMDYFLCGKNRDEQCMDQNSCFLTNCIKHPEDIPSLISYLNQSTEQIETKCKEIYGKELVQLFQHQIYIIQILQINLIYYLNCILFFRRYIMLLVNFMDYIFQCLCINFQNIIAKYISILITILINCKS